MNKFSAYVDTLSSKVSVMADRDKNALKALLVFLVLMMLYGVFIFHQYANKVQKSAIKTEEQFFWLRGQAASLAESNDLADKTSDEIIALIRQHANNQNIELEVVQGSQSIEVIGTHKNASVLGAFLEKLDTDGFTISDISMTQTDNKNIQSKVLINLGSR